MGIRRSVSVNLHVGSTRLVDGLDSLSTFPDNQADFVGSNHDIFSFVPRATGGPASSATTSSSTSPSRVSSPGSAHSPVVVLVQNLEHLGLGRLDRLRGAGDPQRLLIRLVISVLDDDHLGSGLSLQLLDGLSPLADDETHFVTRDKHFKLPSTSSAAHAHARHATAASSSRASLSLSLVRDNPLDHGLC